MDGAWDVCECGDYRVQHRNGEGACVFNKPNDLAHGYEDCLRFRLAATDQPALSRHGNPEDPE